MAYTQYKPEVLKKIQKESLGILKEFMQIRMHIFCNKIRYPKFTNSKSLRK